MCRGGATDSSPTIYRSSRKYLYQSAMGVKCHVTNQPRIQGIETALICPHSSICRSTGATLPPTCSGWGPGKGAEGTRGNSSQRWQEAKWKHTQYLLA